MKEIRMRNLEITIAVSLEPSCPASDLTGEEKNQKLKRNCKKIIEVPAFSLAVAKRNEPENKY